MTGSGLAGPDRFITDIDYMIKKKRFFYVRYITKKINSFRYIALFKVPYDCENEVSAVSSHGLAPRRSASLTASDNLQVTKL